MQTIKVSGTVLDELGQPVIGATVRVKNDQTLGTITDIDGKYSISVSEKATLIFSFVGYRTEEVNVKGRKVINVTLSENSQLLEETVVIGYGSVKKRDLTGAVSSTVVSFIYCETSIAFLLFRVVSILTLFVLIASDLRNFRSPKTGSQNFFK